MKKLILLSLLFPLVIGCAVTRSLKADDVKQRLIGHTPETILACMGVPIKKDTRNNLEVWAYKSVGGLDSYSHSSASLEVQGGIYLNNITGTLKTHKKQYIHTRRRSCAINIVFKDGKVTSVNYSGRRGTLWAHNAQCGYAVENC